jgi:hypothetical protein
LETILPLIQTAAAVSSQEDSMARIMLKVQDVQDVQNVLKVQEAPKVHGVRDYSLHGNIIHCKLQKLTK